jgi:hypothetical protein
MIKIGMAGAHGTGKTSMALAMLKTQAFSKSILVPSTARQIKEYGYPINREATELSQLLVPLLRMVDEYEHEPQAENEALISDRTLVDSLAYTMYQNDHVWESGSLIEFVSRRLTEMHMSSYDYVLYFPIYWDGVEDGVRDPDENYRRAIDSNVLSILELMNIRYLEVPNVSPEARAEWFFGVIQEDYRRVHEVYRQAFGLE